MSEVGNWLNYKRDANGDGTFEVNQTRTHNAANEILTISGGNTLVSHDRNGCMTKIPKPLDGTSGYTLVYDAWNRLISVSDGDTVVATYVYDARNHRIKKTVGNAVTLIYFNRNWQEVESVTAGVTTTYVYGLRYIDDVVCRTTNNNGNIQTLYALQDPNWNVVALVTPSGSVAERMTYDSFGKPTFRAADFTAKTTSSYNWSKTFTGQVYDVETGLMLYRNRYYHPDLGRFITRDPIGYRGKDHNLYRYVRNRTLTRYDVYGLKVVKCQQSGGGLNPTPVYGPSYNVCVPVGAPKFVSVPDCFEGNPCDAGWTMVSLSKDEEDFISAANGDKNTELGMVQILNATNKAGGILRSYADNAGFVYGIKEPNPYYKIDGRGPCGTWISVVKTDLFRIKSCYDRIRIYDVDFSFSAWMVFGYNIKPWSGHNAILIKIMDDNNGGQVFYFDNGVYGGDDHIFQNTPDDIIGETRPRPW